MSFRPVEGNANVAKSTSVPLAVSQTVVAGDALAWASGYAAVATSGTTEVAFVAKQSVTTDGSSHTLCEVYRVDGGAMFEADCTSNTAVTQQGTKVDLTDKVKLANTSTTNKVFLIESVVGAAADKKVRGSFVTQKVA